MVEAQRTYLPAAGRDWALPLYDPIMTLAGAGPTRRILIDQAALRSGDRVLDIGAGTGTLLLVLKRLHPDVDVTGLDPDPKAIARARRKAARAALSIRFDRGFADSLPYPDASFDRVLSSFMFHHLPATEREATLREVRRVLRPGGALHLVDLAGPETAGNRALHSEEQLRDNAEDRMLALMRQAGLAAPRMIEQGTMFFGRVRLVYYRAGAPASAPA
jgi:ubiquinone/menaquinone biosynthesis C-methylase UbiE